MTRTATSARVLAYCLVLGACGGDTSDVAAGQGEHDAGSHDGHTTASENSDAAVDERDTPCTAEFPRFSPGLLTKAGALGVQIVSADPEPPRQKTRNDWILRVTSESGDPVSGATLANPVSFMQVHNHYGNRVPVATSLAEPGQYKLDDIDFIMRGPWEVIFDVVRPGAAAETVRLKICVE